MKLSYEINDDMVDEIEKLTEHAGSRKALFDNAITLLSWALRKVGDDLSVGAYNDSSKVFTELNMPIFDKVRPKG